jgi:hypothetical protein
MGLIRRDHLIDDVDVESCLANLDRLDVTGPSRVVDLTARVAVDVAVAERRIDRAPA